MPSKGPDPALTPRRTPRNIVPVKRGGETVEVQPTAKKSKTKSATLTVPAQTQNPEPEPPAETLPPMKKTRKTKKKPADAPQNDATIFQATTTSASTRPQPTPAPAAALAPPTVIVTPTTPQANEKVTNEKANAAAKKGARKKNNSDIAQKGT